jgi:hypothetical protein
MISYLGYERIVIAVIILSIGNLQLLHSYSSIIAGLLQNENFITPAAPPRWMGMVIDHSDCSARPDCFMLL